MSLGIFVEDQDDTETLKTILRKLGRGSIHRVWVKQGDMLKVDKVASHIKTLKGLRPNVTSVLIFLDSEDADPGATKKKTRSCETALNRIYPRMKINYIIVDHSLEGWLCSDQNALRKVIGPQARISIKGNPEDNLRPAHLLRNLFKVNGRDFNEGTDNPRIAEAITDPRTIARKSPTFQYLLDTLGL